MRKFRKGQYQKNQGDPFFSSQPNPERRNWRKRNNYPQNMSMGNMGMNMGMGPGAGMGFGSYYYPGGMHPAHPMPPMPPVTPASFPSPVHPATATGTPAAVNIHGNNNTMGPGSTVDPTMGYIHPYYRQNPLSHPSTSPTPEDNVPRIANWADDVARHYLVEETMREDQQADEEKKLFLEEYRYPGKQTKYEPPNCPKSTESSLEKGNSSGSGENGKRATSKLRGDAPEFVPKTKREPTWMVVTSW